ncbi:MAG TPA: MFS transporter [Acidimicrobiales bacterium]|nr:MFS transporter [Acidimicrobiales bacterium]
MIGAGGESAEVAELGTGGLDLLRASLRAGGVLPLVLLAGLAAVQGFDQSAFGVLAPEIRRAFHLDNAGIDLVTSLTAAVPILCAVFLGYFGDKGNRVRISRYAALLWGVTAVFTGLAPVLAVLVIARLVGGVGLMSNQTIYPSLISDTYPAEGLPQIFTIFLVGSSGIGLIGSPLAGWLGDAFGWRSAFIVLAVPTFVFAALLKFMPEPVRGATNAAATATTAVTASSALGAVEGARPEIAPARLDGSLMDAFRQLRSVRTLRRTWLAAFLFGGGVVPLATLLSTFFHDIYHVGAAGRGAVGALVGVGSLFGIVTGGLVAQRYSVGDHVRLLPRVTGIAIMEAGAFVFVMAAVPVLWASVAAAFILALGAGSFLPSYATTTSIVTPPELRSQAYAWSLFFFALGAVLIAGFTGVLADAEGQRVALCLLSIPVIAGGLLVFSASRFVLADRDRYAQSMESPS